MGKDRKEFLEIFGCKKEWWKYAIQYLEEPWREVEEKSIEKEWEDGRKRLTKSRYPAEQKTWRREEDGQNEYIEEEKKKPIKVVARFRLGSEDRRKLKEKINDLELEVDMQKRKSWKNLKRRRK